MGLSTGRESAERTDLFRPPVPEQGQYDLFS